MTKDQSGAALSGEWLKARGHGTYNARVKGATLDERKTEPITNDYFRTVAEDGLCLQCMAPLRRITRADGGSYWCCASDSYKGCGWYIGWNRRLAIGYQVRVAG